MCDLMWGGWEHINNLADISVVDGRTFALYGGSAGVGSPAQASLMPARQLQTVCDSFWVLTSYSLCNFLTTK